MIHGFFLAISALWAVAAVVYDFLSNKNVDCLT